MSRVAGGGGWWFFFQAEDGIRDDLVTGVQTCALPISGSWREPSPDVGKRARFLLEDRPVDDARRAFLFGHAARRARLARRAAPKIDEHRPFAVGGRKSSLDIFLDDGQFVPSLEHLLHLLRVARIAAPLHGERRLPVVA